MKNNNNRQFTATGEEVKAKKKNFFKFHVHWYTNLMNTYVPNNFG